MSDKVRIRLLENLPVNREHGAVKGSVWDAEYGNEDERPYWWITGNTGERVGVLGFEAEEVSGQPAPPTVKERP